MFKITPFVVVVVSNHLAPVPASSQQQSQLWLQRRTGLKVGDRLADVHRQTIPKFKLQSTL
jgi:hypothetical protein